MERRDPAVDDGLYFVRGLALAVALSALSWGMLGVAVRAAWRAILG